MAFLKKDLTGISKNLHAAGSRHSLLSESVKTSGVYVLKTYFIAEGDSAINPFVNNW